jgi:hypothetical protein
MTTVEKFVATQKLEAELARERRILLSGRPRASKSDRLGGTGPRAGFSTFGGRRGGTPTLASQRTAVRCSEAEGACLA